MARSLPKEITPIIQGLYSPDFNPEELKLVGAVPTSEEDEQIIERRVKEAEARIFGQGASEGSTSAVPRPLTEEEAAVVERTVDQMREAIAATRRKISRISNGSIEIHNT